MQLAAQTGGHGLPRDSDMQEAEAGEAVPHDDPAALKRGDLLFWKGHVGIIAGENRLLHANGFTMTVAYEPLDKAIDRIAATEWGAITKRGACRSCKWTRSSSAPGIQVLARGLVGCGLVFV